MNINKQNINIIISDLKDKMEITFLEESTIVDVLRGDIVHPCIFLTLDEVIQLHNKLTDLGLVTDFKMGKGPSSASWQLGTNAITNYLVKKRTEIINNIIN